MDPVGTAWTDDNKERLADLLFSREKGIGLSLWRFNFGAGSVRTDRDRAWHPWRVCECFQDGPDAPFDASRHAGQQWFLRAAKRRGVEKTLAFVNSPPVWLTANGHAYADPHAPGTTNLRPGAERAFGRFLARALQYFASVGLPFDYISPINEPQWAWEGGQEGCPYANDDVRRVALALDAELRAAGLNTQIDLIDAGDLRLLLDDDLFREYERVRQPQVHCRIGNEAIGRGKFREAIRDLLGDPEIRRIVHERISSHAYWTADRHHDLTTLRALLRQNLARYAPGARFWQTEFCVMESGRDLGMATALRVARVIHHDLSVAEASAWHWWLALSIADYKDGLIYTDYSANGGPQNLLPSKTLWALGNYSRFVRPGARRVTVETTALPDELLASAYTDIAGETVSVVLVHQGDTPRTVVLESDRRVEIWTPWTTSATRDLARGSAQKGAAFVVPPRAVVTLVGRRGGPVRLPGALPARLLHERPGRPFLYVVRCGAPGASVRSAGSRHVGFDQPFGDDPGTGFRWGYASFGRTGGRCDGEGPFDSLRWEEGGVPGEGMVYRFEVPDPGWYRIEIDLADPWRNPRRAMEIQVNAEPLTRAFTVADRQETLVAPRVAAKQRFLEVRVHRAMSAVGPDEDPLLCGIRIAAVPTQGD